MSVMGLERLDHIVECPNGRREHGFPSLEAALVWAEYGHCCVAADMHTIRREHPVLTGTSTVVRPALRPCPGI